MFKENWHFVANIQPQRKEKCFTFIICSKPKKPIIATEQPLGNDDLPPKKGQWKSKPSTLLRHLAPLPQQVYYTEHCTPRLVISTVIPVLVLWLLRFWSYSVAMLDSWYSNTIKHWWKTNGTPWCWKHTNWNNSHFFKPVNWDLTREYSPARTFPRPTGNNIDEEFLR